MNSYKVVTWVSWSEQVRGTMTVTFKPGRQRDRRSTGQGCSTVSSLDSNRQHLQSCMCWSLSKDCQSKPDIPACGCRHGTDCDICKFRGESKIVHARYVSYSFHSLESLLRLSYSHWLTWSSTWSHHPCPQWFKSILRATALISLPCTTYSFLERLY